MSAAPLTQSPPTISGDPLNRTAFLLSFFVRCVMHRDLKPDNLGFSGDVMKLVRGRAAIILGVECADGVVPVVGGDVVR